MGDGVPHFYFFRCFNAGNNVSHVATPYLFFGYQVQTENPYLVGFVFLARVDEFHQVAFTQAAVDDFVVCDDAAEGIEYGIEDECLQRRVGISLWSRHAPDDGMEDFLDANTRFSARADNIGAGNAEQLHDLVFHFVGHGAVEVDFIEHGDYLQVVLDGHIYVGYGLRLYSLGCVDYQQGAFAGGNGTRHLVGEVNVSRRVDQVEGIFFTLIFIIHLYGVALDRDTPFAFEVHIVEHLRLKVFPLYGFGELQQAVGECTLTMVYVGNDAKIAYILHN